MLYETIKNALHMMNRRELVGIKTEVTSILQADTNLLTIQNGVNEHVNIEVNSIFHIYDFREITMIDGQIIPINPRYNPSGDLQKYFEAHYKQFKTLDKKLIVNLNAIVSYDSFMQRLYSSETNHVRINGTAMRINEKEHFSHLKDMAGEKDRQIEYAPKGKRLLT
ncbi:hypothetical protein M3194_15695 [Paenibacillus glycanilyticus]|uniref:hypothetical protein n=1 Tax=Paenibacillus glycanilyticus TaxID=126569 RepID=UPI0020410D70|nr:hypothetical protein [Paenibacillus glycanilyticus]MCM3628787.1 hypothetical protein [Paenibacillus glycanilyticus]